MFILAPFGAISSDTRAALVAVASAPRARDAPSQPAMAPSRRRALAPLAVALVLASPRPSFASTDADACFWNAATGACQASARWLASNRLVFSDQGLFLADLVGGVETCASAFDDADACAAADHCAYYPAAGACLPDASWSLDKIRRCVLGRGSDVDPAVTAIASLAAECLARSTSSDACAAHTDGRCAWFDPSSGVDAAFCAPDPIRVASEILGAPALAALAIAQSACVAETDPGACDAAAQCAWNDADSQCAADPIGTLRESARSTTARAFLEAVDECRRGADSEDACADVGNDALGCVWGRKSASTNIVPEQYGGDGGDGTGGWWRHDDDHDDDHDGDGVMSCYPSYAMFASKAAPALGLGGGDGECASLQPLFELYAGCAAAGTDAARCDETEACAMSPANGAVASTCVLDPAEAAELLLPSRDADPLEAVNRACEMDGETREECAAASTAAAEAGKAAAREDEDDDEDDEDDEYPSIEARAAGYLVVTCAVVFFAIVAPFAAYANHLKSKGEDVCDRMPEWTREYVPRSLRPAGRAYDQFRGDLDVDDL